MGTIGRAAVVPNNVGTCIIDSHLFRMRVDKSKVLPTYLCHAINGYSELKAQLARMSRGAIMDGLNTTILKECTIPLPPLEEQKRIAQIAGKCDRLRRTRRYTQQLSDTYLQSVFLEMFGDPVTNPKNWNRAKVFDIGDVETGNTPSREIIEYYGNYIEWIKSDNIIDGQMLLTKSEESLSEEGCKGEHLKVAEIE